MNLSLNKNQKFPVTDLRMTRFMISIKDAIDLVYKVIEKSVGGEVFVRKSPSMKITNLAKAINKNAKIIKTGVRPGEKIHEQMIGKHEANNTFEFKDFFVIIPTILNKSRFNKLLKNSKRVKSNFEYSSDLNKKWISNKDFKKWLSDYLKDKNILN